MKKIGQIIACILAIVLFLLSFVSVFVYSTINIQTKSAYASFIEKEYDNLKEKLAIELEKYKNSSSSSDTPSLQQAPNDPETTIPIDSLIEMIQELISQYGTEVDVSSMLEGNSIDSILEIIKNHPEESNDIVKKICETNNISEDELMSIIYKYLNNNDVETENLKNSSSLTDLISSIMGDKSNTSASDLLSQLIFSNTGTTSNPIKETVYNILDEKSQELLSIIKDFLLSDAFEATFSDCIRNTSVAILESAETNQNITLSSRVITELQTHSDSLNTSFSEILDSHDMTYAEFSFLTDQVLYNALETYRLGTFNILTPFSKSLQSLVGDYSDKLDTSVDLQSMSESLQSTLPKIVIKLISYYVKAIFSGSAILALIVIHVIFIAILSLFSFSLSYGIKLTGIIGILDGLLLFFVVFLSGHIWSFVTLNAEITYLIDLIIISLKSSWKITAIWTISIGFALLIFSLIAKVLFRKRNNNEGN